MHSEGVLLKVNTSLMCTETDYVLSPLFTAPPFYVNYHEECTLKEVNTSLMCTETDYVLSPLFTAPPLIDYMRWTHIGVIQLSACDVTSGNVLGT